jgi:hypothetical protein
MGRLSGRHSNPFLRTENHIILSQRLLEMMTYKALLRAHMDTQDNLFTIRAIQLLLFHAVRSVDIVSAFNEKYLDRNREIYDPKAVATDCLVFLLHNNINIGRALRIGQYFADRDVDFQAAPTQYFRLDPSLTMLKGAENCSYIPL